MEESTIIPIPSVRPARVMMFRVSPEKYIIMMVISRLMGIESPIIKVLLILRRKMNRTTMASMAPSRAEDVTPLRDWRMIFVVS